MGDGTLCTGKTRVSPNFLCKAASFNCSDSSSADAMATLSALGGGGGGNGGTATSSFDADAEDVTRAGQGRRARGEVQGAMVGGGGMVVDWTPNSLPVLF
jgi:hypothetical protein